MATRSNIDFYTAFFDKKTKLVARIYKHWDGYPDNMIPLFKKFRKKMLKHYGEAADYGHLINCGQLLAAEFIRVFKSSHDDISICVNLNQDIEYLYELHTWYDFDNTNEWRLKVFDIDNWENKKKLLKTITM